MEAVHLRFSLPARLPDAIKKSIKRADRMAAYLEATQLAGFEEAEAMRLFSRPRGTPADLSLTALPPLKAARLFLRRFELLSGQRIGKNSLT